MIVLCILVLIYFIFNITSIVNVFIFKHRKKKYVEARFDTSNFEIDRPLTKGKNKKVIGLMKDELGGQIMKQFVGLRAKTYSYLKDNNDEDKKAKGTRKCVIKRKLFRKKLEAAIKTIQKQLKQRKK